MMNIVSKKMIKPSTPTPPNLRNYEISFSDQFMPPMNVPIILFYSSPTIDLLDRLEQSLSNILPRFYPLAGRYVRKDHLVHCNDEGVEFVEARACPENFKSILEYVESGTHEKLNDLLVPRLSCEVDEAADPIVAIQATKFACGGLAIGISVSHRIFDTESVSTFILAWAEEASNTSDHPRRMGAVNPSFDSPTLLPFKNVLPGMENPKLPRTLNPSIISKRFLFDEGTISTLKARVRDGSRRVSKVGVVCALISKAMIRVDRLKHGAWRRFLIGQVVNVRNRTVPPFRKHSCGNLTAMSALKLRPTDDVGFEDLVCLLREAIDKTIADCAGVYGEEGLDKLYGSSMEIIQAMMSGSSDEEETTVLFSLSDWSKFDYYEADFGWGKPIWASIATLPASNVVVLMGNKEGNGIEAWVHLLKEDVALFEQELGLCT